MTRQVARKSRTNYSAIQALPDGVIGEIIDGELFTSPRPSPAHSLAQVGLSVEIGGPFQMGKGGGPGGWWILVEPEIHLGSPGDQEGDVLVPDLAGWRRTRLPAIPTEAFLTVVPDWVCEVLSPTNQRLDRVRKVPKYAACGVQHLWLVDPQQKTLEVFRLENGKWLLLAAHAELDKVRAEPFESVEMNLGSLWGQSP